jgi:hypothetical protein
MAQTNHAWDRGVELAMKSAPSSSALRGTVAELRKQLDQAHDSLRMSRQRERDATEALNWSRNLNDGPLLHAVAMAS